MTCCSGAQRATFCAAGTATTVAFLDLNDFKLVNDEHGHRIGDRVLAAIAMAVKRELRPSDGLGRLGGTEHRCGQDGRVPDEGPRPLLVLAEGGAVDLVEQLTLKIAEGTAADHLGGQTSSGNRGCQLRILGCHATAD